VAHSVVYAPEAQDDLVRLYVYIAPRAGPEVARAYIARIEAYCMRLANFPRRGRSRDDLQPGLRVTGFERRVAIAFHVAADTVIVDRVLYGGRDVDGAFAGRTPNA
jgi:toxin ParE1/3/4